MVKWIGKFLLLLKRLRDAWMDMLPLSTMSEERTQNEYLADVTQEHAERPRRTAEVLDPNAQETRDKWYATQVSNHEITQNKSTSTKKVAEPVEREDLGVHKIPLSGYCSKFNNTDDE